MTEPDRTANRTPTGDHPLPSKVHHLDLEVEADKLLARLPGHRRQSETLAREGGVSTVLMAMEAGDLLQDHSAGGVVTIHLIRGYAMVGADERQIEVRPGQMVMLQPALRHNVQARDQSVLLLTING